MVSMLHQGRLYSRYIRDFLLVGQFDVLQSVLMWKEDLLAKAVYLIIVSLYTSLSCIVCFQCIRLGSKRKASSGQS